MAVNLHAFCKRFVKTIRAAASASGILHSMCKPLQNIHAIFMCRSTMELSMAAQKLCFFVKGAHSYEVACLFSPLRNVCVTGWTGAGTFCPRDVCSEQKRHPWPGSGLQRSCPSRRPGGIGTPGHYRLDQRAGRIHIHEYSAG